MRDLLILGAGAAGMMAAAMAGQRGVRVTLLDHAAEPGRKILISGGGRCNFTNLKADARYYLSRNPHFAHSALARYSPQDFLKLLEKHHIPWHEKEEGQLFCDHSAADIVTMLRAECDMGQVQLVLGVSVEAVQHHGDHFSVRTSAGLLRGRALALATGGLAIPKLGATGLALDIARQFGLSVVPTKPALVPLLVPEIPADLAGVSLPVTASLCQTGRRTGKGKPLHIPSFTNGMVLTHNGLSGPAILQISSWLGLGDGEAEERLCLNLFPRHKTVESVLAGMMKIRAERPRAQAPSILPELPQRLARWFAPSVLDSRPLAAQPLKSLYTLAEKAHRWLLHSSGTAGYVKAEVMRGGIDTGMLSSRTMEVTSIRGLYIVGEAVDVTGWLGGYNFQWAWASGFAAGGAVADYIANR